MSEAGAAFRAKVLSEQDIHLPEPPAGGGYLVLAPHQFANPTLRDAIAKAYPDTRIIESVMLPTG